MIHKLACPVCCKLTLHRLKRGKSGDYYVCCKCGTIHDNATKMREILRAVN